VLDIFKTRSLGHTTTQLYYFALLSHQNATFLFALYRTTEILILLKEKTYACKILYDCQESQYDIPVYTYLIIIII